MVKSPLIRQANFLPFAGLVFLILTLAFAVFAGGAWAQASSAVTATVSPTEVQTGEPVTASGEWAAGGCPTDSRNWLIINWGDGKTTVLDPAPNEQCHDSADSHAGEDWSGSHRYGNYSADHSYDSAGSYDVCVVLGHSEEVGEDKAEAGTCFGGPPTTVVVSGAAQTPTPGGTEGICAGILGLIVAAGLAVGRYIRFF